VAIVEANMAALTKRLLQLATWEQAEAAGSAHY
jgi:hypothetical protein